MNKDTVDKRLMGKKAYFTSRNLTRPEVVYEDLSLTDCLKNMIFIEIILYMRIIS